MNKNIVAITIGIISLGLFVAAAALITPQTDLSHAQIAEDEYNELLSSRKETDRELLSNIKFNDRKIYYAEKNNTWYYSIVENDKNAHNPKIRFDGENSIKIAFKGKQSIDEDLISSNTQLIFAAYNDSVYREYKLVATTLPIVSIEHENELLKDTDINMQFELYDNREKTIKRITKTAGKIHIRGQGSSIRPKKPYRLNLRYYSPGEHERNANEPLLGMREDDDWILNGADNDAEKIRNTFTEQLISAAEDDSLESRYVELIKNGEYQGLYMLSTTKDEKSLGYDKDSYEYYLFKKNDWTQNDTQISKKPIQGYALTSKTVDSEERAWRILSEYLYKTRTSFDFDFAIEHTDIDSLIDHFLITELSNNIDVMKDDGATKNIIYQISNRDDYKVKIIAWDHDITWGGDVVNNWEVPYSIGPDNFIDYSNQLIGKIVEHDNSYFNKIRKRYKNLRNDAWSNENIAKLIDRNEEKVFQSGAYNRDMWTWEYGVYVNRNDLDYFRTYVYKRLEYMDFWFGLREDEPEPLEEDWFNGKTKSPLHF